MKKFVTIFVIFLLISSCIYSQSSYPQLTVQGTDTLVQITLQQMKQLNLFKVQYDECEELSTKLDALNISTQLQLDLQTSLIDNKNKELGIWESRLANANNTVNELQSLISTDSKKINWLKVQRTGLAAIVIGLLGYTAVNLLK